MGPTAEEGMEFSVSDNLKQSDWPRNLRPRVGNRERFVEGDPASVEGRQLATGPNLLTQLT